MPITKAFRTLLRAVAEPNCLTFLRHSADNDAGECGPREEGTGGAAWRRGNPEGRPSWRLGVGHADAEGRHEACLDEAWVAAASFARPGGDCRP